MRVNAFSGLCLIVLTAPLWGDQGRTGKAAFPEDFGSGVIDVAGYPQEFQKTYREIFLPVFDFLGQTARIVNSPIIELDPRLEAAERQANPELFADEEAAKISRDGWKREVERLRNRPPCCGACPVLSRPDAKALWRFLVYDSITRKTGPSAQAWLRYRRDLIGRYRRLHE